MNRKGAPALNLENLTCVIRCCAYPPTTDASDGDDMNDGGANEDNREDSAPPEKDLHRSEKPRKFFLTLLPLPQENTVACKCWRCGEEGHSKKRCNRQVSCTYCQVYSHATRACKKYASFVRNSQGMSSKRTTPVQGQANIDARTQGPPVLRPRYVTNNYPRFQPPVVPPMIRPSVITQRMQTSPHPRQLSQQGTYGSPQDVREDPNYNSQEARISQSTSQPQVPQQEAAMYVKCPIPIGNEVPPTTSSNTISSQSQGQPQVPQGIEPQASQEQHQQLYAKIRQEQNRSN